MRGRLVTLATLAPLAVGCTDDSFLVVTVNTRPAVHGATKLKVTLSNAGSMRTDDLDLSGHDFPVTFSLSAPGRGGELGISVDALDGNSALVGRGVGQTTLGENSAAVTLESADFVVNTDVALNQFLTSDFEAVGLQLAATTTGTWMTSWRDDCTNCDIYGRRFDATGLPVESALAASTNAFKVNTELTTAGAFPALASNAMNQTLAFWDFQDTVSTTQGVACRVINESGAGSPSQTSIALESADVVTAAPIKNGNIAVTWQTFQSTTPAMEVIRAMIVKPDCTPLLANAATVSQTVLTSGHHRSHVASVNNTILYAWVADDGVYVRNATLGNTLGAEINIVKKTTQFVVDFVRVVPWGAGYGLAVRWSSASGASTDPGKIEIYRLNDVGSLQGSAILVTDKSRTDFASDKAFGLAHGTNDSLMVTWHACETGAGSCEVYGRIIDKDGMPLGDAFVVPTSTGSDQVNPSVAALPDGAFVVAWNDSSGLDPDRSGSAVRARIIYSPTTP
jgi:hypothetical protein